MYYTLLKIDICTVLFNYELLFLTSTNLIIAGRFRTYEMKIRKTLISAAVLLLFCFSGSTQIIDIPTVSEQQLHHHVSFLASDSLRGRGTGTPEIKKAARYLKQNLRKMNLVSPDTSYFQHFSLTSSHHDEKNSYLKVLNKRGKVKKSTRSFIPFNQSTESLELDGDLVFAGFGYDKQSMTDTYSPTQNVNGKIVLYSAGSPATFMDETSGNWNSVAERNKMDNFFDNGAKALILVTSIHDNAQSTFNQFKRMSARQAYSFKTNEKNDNPPVFIITPETADELTGRRFKWAKILQDISENMNPEQFELKDNRISIVSLQKIKTMEAANVVGYIEGSDSILKDECIVFISHYDHLGVAKNGDIFNGADDNASGVATLLEVAGMFASLENRPSRSMLFLFPAAEEIGLLGSDYYSRNPVFPLDKTVACINLDMVGRAYEPRDSVWKKSPKLVKDFNGIYALVNNFNPDLKGIASDACSQLELEPDFSLPGRFFYSSDHYHFHKNGIPILNFSTGYSADYHKITDTADRIRPDKMKKVAQLCYIVGMEISNRDYSKIEQKH